MDPLDLYLDNYKKSLFRFEGLQDYSAEDGEENVLKFIETGDVGMIASENEWWKDLKSKKESGFSIDRVSLIKRPVSDYSKWAIAFLKVCAEFSGIDIKVVEELQFNIIAPHGLKDFYVVDDIHVILMNYADKGKYLDSVLADDQIEKYTELKNELIKFSMSIQDFIV